MRVHVEWGDDFDGGDVDGLLEAMGSPTDTLPHMWWLRITGPHGIPAIIQIPQGMEDTVTIEAQQ
jgi:hypothetical protein